jgi:hypothetical protein
LYVVCDGSPFVVVVVVLFHVAAAQQNNLAPFAYNITYNHSFMELSPS